jgi:predicted HAD superfamily Cof-like phosphohydrolase
MKKQLNAVEEFHNSFNEANGTIPKVVDMDIYDLRYRLMREENEEYLEACKENDIVEIADALGDQLYILCGTILKHGMQHIIEDVFSEIHRSNMSKLDENGKPIFRLDGKIMKSNLYEKPNLVPIIYGKDC